MCDYLLPANIKACIIIIITDQLFNQMESVNHFQIQDSEKVVLFWTKFFGIVDYNVGLGKKPFAGCPVSNCRTTSDRNLINRSDALIFHSADVKLNDMPTIRRAEQRWIWFNYESPNTTSIYTLNEISINIINWTMTYRTDSDVYLGYDLVQSEETFSKLPHLFNQMDKKFTNRNVEAWRPLVRGKTKKVAWFVSHCWTDSHRENFAIQLQAFIDVDIYVPCGQLRCPPGTDCC